MRRRSSAERGAESARNLEFSSRGGEARALRDIGDSLDDFEDSAASRSALGAAAKALSEACSDFSNPPLNAIWAEAGRDENDVGTLRESDPEGAAKATWEWEGGARAAERPNGEVIR